MGLTNINLMEVMNVFYKNGIEGKSLCMLGKQTIVSKGPDVHEYVKRFAPTMLNAELVNYLRNVYICDSVEMFKRMGFSEVHAIDISDYEGADIILDLNEDRYCEMKFDYVVDGGYWNMCLI